MANQHVVMTKRRNRHEWAGTRKWRRAAEVAITGDEVVITKLGEEYELWDEAESALIELSAIRDTDKPTTHDDIAAYVRRYGLLEQDMKVGASESVRDVGERAFEVRQIVSFASSVRREDVAELRGASGAPSDGSADELFMWARSEIAEYINSESQHVGFEMVTTRDGFDRRLTPTTPLAAIYARLAERIGDGRTIGVCDRRSCHRIFLRDDRRPQRYHDDPCEMADYYDKNQDDIKSKRKATRAKERRVQARAKGKRR